MGTGTIAQFVKSLPHKHEDLSLIVKNPSEKKKFQAQWLMLTNPELERGRREDAESCR